ncbi:membrane protein insertase YidC [Paracoccaceae bacterium]|nr:membrane protein insertase YidC [Paracoccaceae bacterium]
MDDQNKNLLLATSLSFLVLLGWMLMFPPEPIEEVPSDQITEQVSQETREIGTGLSTPVQVDTDQSRKNVDLSSDAPRVPIETSRLSGSLSLKGGKIDNLKLLDYFETQDENSKNIELFQFENENYYAVYGWSSRDRENVPSPNTLWSLAKGRTLSPDTPITLQWTSPKGIIFEREISIDKDFLFTVKQRVFNQSSATIDLAAYGILARHSAPETIGFYILHEGIVGYDDGELAELSYDDITDQKYDDRERANLEIYEITENGWIGFTDKYWMSTLVGEPKSKFKVASKYNEANDIYQADIRHPLQSLGAGQSTEIKTYLFAGAKEVNTIKKYQRDKNFADFIDTVDWGWFFFLTKPIFSLLDYCNKLVGNMGWAIILLTLVVKTVLLPLAYKSYVSMSKLKQLQPEMEKIKKRAGDDRMKLQQEMMALYKKEKVNPAAGCLPILLQIPIFFSLYKVLFVTIEVRHAPFFGWITDLSAPDPSSILNLFGLLPFSPPSPESFLVIFSIGVFPILMGVTMWLQQKLNPAPTDKTQQMIFAWMPWIFMFLLGQFSSGLVIYWVANNIITFAQQYFIMASQGVKPDIFGNILNSFKKEGTSKEN